MNKFLRRRLWNPGFLGASSDNCEWGWR